MHGGRNGKNEKGLARPSAQAFTGMGGKREGEEEEGKRIRKEELEGLKIAQLQEELDNLRKSRSLEEKISKDNLPLTYLLLEHHPNTIRILLL